MKTMKKLAIIILSIVIASSCSKEEADSVIRVPLGERFEIELEANLSTGYSWQRTNSDQTAIVDSVNHEFIASDTSRLGNPEIEVWEFLATLKGEEVLLFEYVGPESANSFPSNSKEFRVHIY